MNGIDLYSDFKLRLREDASQEIDDVKLAKLNAFTYLLTIGSKALMLESSSIHQLGNGMSITNLRLLNEEYEKMQTLKQFEKRKIFLMHLNSDHGIIASKSCRNRDIRPITLRLKKHSKGDYLTWNSKFIVKKIFNLSNVSITRCSASNSSINMNTDSSSNSNNDGSKFDGFNEDTVALIQHAHIDIPVGNNSTNHVCDDLSIVLNNSIRNLELIFKSRDELQTFVDWITSTYIR